MEHCGQSGWGSAAVRGLGIYLAGGANLAGQLPAEIDALVLKVYPIVIGSGVPVFSTGLEVHDFTLEPTRTFDNGTLVLSYKRIDQQER
ncbi:hypothetical protein [Streptomyces sp. H27-C3]|uniref:hypothetical protein n=1 Tax=Streptomyces sp. H27-C3 TaxID=3046305 RepID=UPI0024BAFE24|nr:hypothetical protein [Streptomyces sp. H27-C3]MDJ0462176.1 hypothetical protein [Streptomyces sp. H27-C3]